MTPASTIEAAKRLLRIKKAGQSFSGFIEMRHPEWAHRPSFHDELIQVIDDLLNDRLFNDKGERVDNLVHQVLDSVPVPEIHEWLTEVLKPGDRLALDPSVQSIAGYEQLARALVGLRENIEVDPGHARQGRAPQRSRTNCESIGTGRPVAPFLLPDFQAVP